MPWTYRVVKERQKDKGRQKDQVSYRIVEYYDGGGYGEVGHICNYIEDGDSEASVLADMRWQLTRMLLAFAKPVIDLGESKE